MIINRQVFSGVSVDLIKYKISGAVESLDALSAFVSEMESENAQLREALQKIANCMDADNYCHCAFETASRAVSDFKRRDATRSATRAALEGKE